MNGTTKCEGKLTRVKMKKKIMEVRILDYFIVCEQFYNLINKMVVDEEQKYVLKKYSKVRGQTKITKSDHNIMLLDINVPWNSKVIEKRQEFFNIRNKDCQQKFFEFTSHTTIFSYSVLIDDVRKAGKVWLKNMKFAVMQNFKKIRMSNKQDKKSEINILLEKQASLQTGSDEFYESERQIAEMIANR